MLDDISILSIENISKSYGDKTLFEEINLTIEANDKIGLIGINGTGKSTFLKIIMGLESKDNGKITTMKDIRIEYLPQYPVYNTNTTIIEHIFKGNSEPINCIRDYEELLRLIDINPDNLKLQERLLKSSEQIDTLNLWEYENQVKTILTKLGITNFNQKINTLSGGQKKRVALASVLISPCDLLILDEPTNHMDNDLIDWLETYLKNRKDAILMITHDRYFLDRVANKIIEFDKGALYNYKGNYSYFIEKKIERQLLETSIEQKKNNLYRNELAWIKRGAKARTTKQKARIKRFETLEDSKDIIRESSLTIPTAYSRLGNKIIEIDHISKSFNSIPVINDFSYIVLKDDRIGIIGDNGCGKSTLLNILTEKIIPESGIVNIGTTVKIGYFSQEMEEMNEDIRAIEFIKEIAEYVHTADGAIISAAQIMESFLFAKDSQWTYISRLSGGEKRRLYLLKILISEPNILLLDEPTNDFDLETLNVLENYLDDFQGAVIIVSHDRYFLDRTCNRIFSFKGKGEITEHIGNYTDYIEYNKRITIKNINNNIKSTTLKPIDNIKTKTTLKKKLTYKEKKEFEQLPAEIKSLEKKLTDIDNKLNQETTDFVKVNEYSLEKDSLEEELLLKLEKQEYFINLNEDE